MNGIIIKTNVYGTHNWKGVEDIDGLDNVQFLKHQHLHNFYITCKKDVKHGDRDIEIIDFKFKVDFYLNKQYGTEYGYLNFEGRSCEMIANELADKFQLNYCEVLEDDNFGGYYERS